jgi:hypothetical protein
MKSVQVFQYTPVVTGPFRNKNRMYPRSMFNSCLGSHLPSTHYPVENTKARPRPGSAGPAAGPAAGHSSVRSLIRPSNRHSRTEDRILVSFLFLSE